MQKQISAPETVRYRAVAIMHYRCWDKIWVYPMAFSGSAESFKRVVIRMIWCQLVTKMCAWFSALFAELLFANSGPGVINY